MEKKRKEQLKKDEQKDQDLKGVSGDEADIMGQLLKSLDMDEEFIQNSPPPVKKKKEPIKAPPSKPALLTQKRQIKRPTTSKTLLQEKELLHSDIEDYQLTSSVDNKHLSNQLAEVTDKKFTKRIVSADLEADRNAYGIKQKVAGSLAKKMIDQLEDPKQMLIYHEIFGPPKSSTKSQSYHDHF